MVVNRFDSSIPFYNPRHHSFQLITSIATSRNPGNSQPIQLRSVGVLNVSEISNSLALNTLLRTIDIDPYGLLFYGS